MEIIIEKILLSNYAIEHKIKYLVHFLEHQNSSDSKKKLLGLLSERIFLQNEVEIKH